MTYRAFITDLDGTAVLKGSDGSDTPDSLVEAVGRVKGLGVKVACATGRPWRLAQSVIKRLGLVEPCIVEGGARIVDPVSGGTLWSQPIGEESIVEILKLFKKYDEGGTLIYSGDVGSMKFNDVDTKSITAANYLYLLGLPEAVAGILARELNDVGEDYVAHITPSWRGEDYDDVHVTHLLADKEHAIKQWQSMMGVTMVETVGMGDSGNDMPIFNAVGLKVAVGNASLELKAISDYIAPSQADGALEDVLQRFF